jgi:hypothetical protein
MLLAYQAGGVPLGIQIDTLSAINRRKRPHSA